MFGVVVCPKCNRARGVKLGSARARCNYCGHSIDLSKARIFYKAETETQLAEGVKRMMERIATQGLDADAEIARKRKVPTADRKPSKKAVKDPLKAAAQLTALHGTFDLGSFRETLGVSSDEEATSVIEKLLGEGELLEPRPGIYRVP
ncbi:MAG TPA: DUF1922 domain-containing protein [Methanomassiliicoccales archaeon]|nr:DUF1922 domain-containing protein [Methanomassiliicoccales archaeon]